MWCIHRNRAVCVFIFSSCVLSVLTLWKLSCSFSISTRYYSSEDGTRCYHWSSGRNDPTHRNNSQCSIGEVVVFQKKMKKKLQVYSLGRSECRLLPKGRGDAEAEHCYEAGRGSGFISKGPVPQCLSEQSSVGEGSEVHLRVQIIRQAHSNEVRLQSQAIKSGSGSGPESNQHRTPSSDCPTCPLQWAGSEVKAGRSNQWVRIQVRIKRLWNWVQT